MVRICRYLGHVLVRDHLALNKHQLDVSAVRHRSQPRSTSAISHAMWTANTSWRYSPSMVLSSPSKCRLIAIIRSSLVDMLMSILSRLMMLTKQSSTWMAVGRLFLCESLMHDRIFHDDFTTNSALNGLVFCIISHTPSVCITFSSIYCLLFDSHSSVFKIGTLMA